MRKLLPHTNIFVTADSDDSRSPQHFLYVTIVGIVEIRKNFTLAQRFK